MNRRAGLILELCALYGLLPGLFLLNLGRPVMTVVLVGAFLYVGVHCFRLRLFHRDTQRPDWRAVLPTFVVFALVSTAVLAAVRPELLFGPPRHAPQVWLTFLFIYSVFSVVPQALVFRVFFLERYSTLFSNQHVLILVNATAFAWAHTIINHPLVYVLTFFGGVLFARTYLQSRSLVVTSAEHALYGAWLFTVGLGTVFAFPI